MFLDLYYDKDIEPQARALFNGNHDRWLSHIKSMTKTKLLAGSPEVHARCEAIAAGRVAWIPAE